MEYQSRDWSHPSQRDLPNSQSAFHFELGRQIGETNSRLETLITEVRDLPEGIAIHLAHELKSWGLVPEATPKQGFVGVLKLLMTFLQSALPYVQMAKRWVIALVMAAAAVVGNYNPELAKHMIDRVVGYILGV